MYVNVCEEGFLPLCILYITEKQMNAPKKSGQRAWTEKLSEWETEMAKKLRKKPRWDIFKKEVHGAGVAA